MYHYYYYYYYYYDYYYLLLLLHLPVIYIYYYQTLSRVTCEVLSASLSRHSLHHRNTFLLLLCLVPIPSYHLFLARYPLSYNPKYNDLVHLRSFLIPSSMIT